MSASIPQSNTPTLAGEPSDDDSARHLNDKSPQMPVSKPHFPASHDPDQPDISFPFDTTRLDDGGFTDEYRTVARTGLISADTALRPVPSHLHRVPTAFRDPEKAKHLKDVKLVTWLENDPEDARNLPRWYEWCMYFSIYVYLSALTNLSCRYHRRLRSFRGLSCICQRRYYW